MNPLIALGDFGQSPWLDFIDRDLISSGSLARLIQEDGIRGLTSNPAIFEKAFAGEAYVADIARLGASGVAAEAIYETLAIEDVRAAADALAPVYSESGGRDGFVSLELAPVWAHDRMATVAEAQRLWARIDRPNAMIKVPGTPAGIEAVEEVIAAGINVNVTLLFACDAYDAAADAHWRGLERRLASGQEIRGIASVASFFVSRIDTAVDARIDDLLRRASPGAQAGLAALRGQAAIANARLAYDQFRALRASTRWRQLEKQGAQPQRLLWASTGTKNPAYRDVVYVEELVGPETVNTLPLPTLTAFRDHGRVRASLSEPAASLEVMDAIAAAGVDFPKVTDELLVDGLHLFSTAFDRMLAAVVATARGPSP